MDIYSILLPAWFGISAVTAIALRFLKAPYGKYFSTAWGPAIPNKAGWIVMELALLLFLYQFGYAQQAWSPAQTILLIVVLHYVYRSLLFPLMTRTSGKKIPIIIVLLAIGHNLGNAFLLGTGINRHTLWSSDAGSLFPAFNWHIGLGLIVVILGFCLHFWADQTLIRLRKPNETGYKIPTGGMYKWISCPNYLGEMLQWYGFALLTMSPAALAFAVFTTANLGPRAIDTHRWYQQTFTEYPPERTALIPKIL